MLKDEPDVALAEGLSSEAPKEEIIEAKEKKKPEEILRGAGFKIRLVTPTSFGTQIDFARVYPEDKIKAALKAFDTKIKGKSVFIVD